MKDTKMERLVLLPFSVGCISQSSVAVGHEPQPRRSSKPSITNSSNSAIKGAREEDEESLSSGESLKNSLKVPASQKPNISSGFHRLYKSLKSFSQSLVDKEEMEELEMGIEIGFPTDVKHVTHIGWDGSATNNPVKGWDNLIPPELLSLPQVSLRQLDQLSMSPHAQIQHQPLPNHIRTSDGQM